MPRRMTRRAIAEITGDKETSKGTFAELLDTRYRPRGRRQSQSGNEGERMDSQSHDLTDRVIGRATKDVEAGGGSPDSGRGDTENTAMPSNTDGHKRKRGRPSKATR